MATLDDLIGADDVVSRITWYELQRGDERVFIHLFEVLTGPDKGRFYAYPTLLLGRTKDQYLVDADSHDEAITECLSRLKGVPLKETRDIDPEESEE